MNRRNFLKWVTATGAIELSAATGLIALAPNKKVSPYKISTENADYVFVLGMHDGSQQLFLPEGIKKWNGFFAETGMYGNFLSADSPDLKEFLQTAHEHPFYKNLIPQLIRENVPLLFGDIAPRFRLGYNDMHWQIARGSLYTAGTVLGSNVAIGKESKSVTRREFFKRMLGATIGIWSFARLLKEFQIVAPNLTREPWAKHLRELVSFGEFSHPEEIVINLRNALIAKKLLYYSREFKLHHNREKPTIGVAMGSGHEFISEYLKRGEKFCMLVINMYPESVLKKFVSGYETQFPLLVELAGNNFKKFYDPELQRKVSNLEKESSVTSSENKG